MTTSTKSFIVNKYFSEIERELQNTKSTSNDGNLKKSSSNLSLLFSGEQQVQYGGTWANLKREDRLYGKDGRIRRLSSNSNTAQFAAMEDLIQISGPLTEDAIIRVLQARFYRGQYYTSTGPILLLVNPCHLAPSTRCLSLSQAIPAYIQRVVNRSMLQLQEYSCSQSVVLNGCSGSGKTHTSLLLLRQLFDMAGGGAETDAFKHLNAALTVLRSLSCAATIMNKESSRMGLYIENYISDGAIHRTKIHCITVDESRIVQIQAREKNFHIFYQLLAGLSAEEKVKYHLDGQAPETLNYLLQGETSQNLHQDKSRFDTWRSCLSVLGIPVSDILRIMSTILLLGNIQFLDGTSLQLEVKGNSELQSVAALLGVSAVTLYDALSKKTHKAGRQMFITPTDQITANRCRDYLAKALYMRTLSAVIKRANSSRRPNMQSNDSTSSNDSNGQDTQYSPHQSPNSNNNNHPSSSLHHHLPNSSHSYHKSLSQSRTSSTHNSPKSATTTTEAFVAVLDMMGFEKLQRNELEQLCINLTAETLQHFYNTHVFKSSEEACIEEGIQCDIDISYHENAPVVELISSQRIGILSLLDTECFVTRSNTDTYIHKTRVQHKMNSLFSEGSSQDCKSFGISHFAGKVEYDVTNFMLTNQDRLPDDVIWLFNKKNCHFGFVTHLFTQELKLIQDRDGGPQGNYFRCFSSLPSDSHEAGSDCKSTLSLDYHTKLDNLLKTLVQTNPHFIRCIKSNTAEHQDQFERECVVKQLRSLGCLETLHLMAAGFPHRYRYRVFNQRYRVLVKPTFAKQVDPYSDTKVILDGFIKMMDDTTLPYASANWALGKKHIFLSESARQQFELLRDAVMNSAALVIQANWRRRLCQKQWPVLKRQLELKKRRVTPPPPVSPKLPHLPPRKNGLTNVIQDEQKSDRILEKTINMYGLNKNEAPPLPPTRPYTVQGDRRVCFPQFRFMKQNYTDLTGATLVKGENIRVVGFAHRRGYLTVDIGGTTMQVPHQLTDVKKTGEKDFVDV